MIRIWFLTGLVAFVGTLVSGIVSYRSFDQERALTQVSLLRAVDNHTGVTQDRFVARELLARVTSNLLQAPIISQRHVLQPLRSSIYAFQTDFLVASWVARLAPSDFPAAQEQLALAGAPDPHIRNSDNSPVTVAEAGRRSDVVMDVEPRNARTNVFLGRIVNREPVFFDAFQRALTDGRPTASDPAQLFGSHGPFGIVLVTPVYKQDEAVPIGFVSYSYRLSHLMLQNDDVTMYSVALRVPDQAGVEYVADGRSEVSLRQQPKTTNPPIERKLNFGGKDWTLVYYPKIDARSRAMESALVTGIIGMSLTLLACLLYGYAGYNNIRLKREIDVRKQYERRLTAMIDELNHRVKNVLAVIQSIITRTLRHGAGVERARDLLIGRIHAMSSVISLLSDTNWQGVSLRAMFDPKALTRAERVEVSGPDLMISARAAQSLSLVLFELSSHSDEGLALVGQPPHILARWEVTGKGPEAVFHFKWEEMHTSLATRRPDTEFGIVLLDRVAPEALGGTARRYFTDHSFVYELTAPLDTLLDMTERLRTEALSVPIGQ